MCIGVMLQGKDEFLGRTICKPMVKQGMSDERTCVLQWHQLVNKKGDAGELLASFELFLVSVLVLPSLFLSIGCMWLSFSSPNYLLPVQMVT